MVGRFSRLVWPCPAIWLVNGLRRAPFGFRACHGHPFTNFADRRPMLGFRADPGRSAGRSPFVLCLLTGDATLGFASSLAGQRPSGHLVSKAGDASVGFVFLVAHLAISVACQRATTARVSLRHWPTGRQFSRERGGVRRLVFVRPQAAPLPSPPPTARTLVQPNSQTIGVTGTMPILATSAARLAVQVAGRFLRGLHGGPRTARPLLLARPAPAGRLLSSCVLGRMSVSSLPLRGLLALCGRVVWGGLSAIIAGLSIRNLRLSH